MPAVGAATQERDKPPTPRSRVPVAASVARERDKHPPRGPGCQCLWLWPRKGTSRLQWSLAAAVSMGKAGPCPGWLRPARGREAWVLGACNWPEEGILGPECGERQRQLGEIRPAGEQLGAIRQAEVVRGYQASRGVRGDHAGRQVSV